MRKWSGWATNPLDPTREQVVAKAGDAVAAAAVDAAAAVGDEGVCDEGVGVGVGAAGALAVKGDPARRRALGRACKRLIDLGRLHFLRCGRTVCFSNTNWF